MNTQSSLYEIRLEMWRRGSTFVQDLSRCLGSADLENRAKLMAAFPEIIERYDALALLNRTDAKREVETEDNA